MLLKIKVILLLIISYSSLIVNCSAQDTVSLSLPVINSCNNDTLTIPVNARNCNDVGSVGIKIQFDTLALKFIGISYYNPALKHYLYNVKNDVFIFSWVSLYYPANIGDGRLFDIAFVCKGKTASDIKFISGCEIMNINTLKPFALNLSDGSVNKYSGNSIKGYVVYDNSLLSPLHGVRVMLYDFEGRQVDTAFSDINGRFGFQNISCGKYVLKADYSARTGGISPLDALLVLRTFINLYKPTDELRKKTSDVDNDNKITPLDALLINRHFTGMINTFPSGDWFFESNAINIEGYSLSLVLKGICFGDTNASFIPPK